MLIYRYTGDEPTVFIHLNTADGTWVPSKGDTYESALPIAHPLLELVAPVTASEESVKETVPAKPETKEPVTADELKES